MSDQPLGPGWWYASDGKWYPPAAAPYPPQGWDQPTFGQKTAHNMKVGALVGIVLGVVLAAVFATWVVASTDFDQSDDPPAEVRD